MAAPAVDSLVEAEQIRLVSGNAVRVPLGLAVLLAGLAAIVHQRVPGPLPFVWAGVILALFSVRAVLAYRVIQPDKGPASRLRAGRAMRWLTTVAGVTAAGGVLLFMPVLHADEQALFTMFCFGWIAGAVGVSGAYPRLLIPYFTVFGGSLVVAWLLYGATNRLLVSGLLALLVYFLWRAVTDIGAQAAKSINMGFENVDLLNAKSRFMAAASHDLRQPLAALGFLRSSIVAAKVLEDAWRYAEQLRTPLGTLESILDSLAEIAKLDSGSVKAVPRPVALDLLAAQLRDEFAVRAQSRNLSFDVEAGADTVLVDHHLLLRTLSNLIDNALKFTSVGGVSVRFERPGPDTLNVLVTDTGPGVPLELQQQIFEEYFQIDNPSREPGRGVGLGLAIVKRLVMIQGGVVAVESKLGVGSTFRVSLPAPAASSTGVVEARLVTPLSTGSLSGRVVLFIEDDADLQDAMAAWAETRGVRALFASNGSEAMVAAGVLERHPDAVVCDYLLPGESNGLEVLAGLRERWPGIPLVLLTATGDGELAKKAHDHSVVFITKPIDGEQFEQKMLAAIGGA